MTPLDWLRQQIDPDAPNPETQGLGGEFQEGTVDLQELEEFVNERDVSGQISDLLESGELSAGDVTENTGYFDGTTREQLLYYFDEFGGPFTREIERRASAQAGGGYANYTYPLTRTVQRMIRLVPSVDAGDIPLEGDNNMSGNNNSNNDGSGIGSLINPRILVLCVLTVGAVVIGGVGR